jgi:hypothetical protein
MKRKPAHSYFQLMEKRGINKKAQQLGNTEVHHTGEITMTPLVPTSLKEKNNGYDFTQVVENNSVEIDNKRQVAFVYLNKTDITPVEVDLW